MDNERIVADASGGVVFDPRHAPNVDLRWLDPGYWRDQGLLQTLDGGRGGVFRVSSSLGPVILRPYRRGGMAARVSRDRFIWAGRDKVRSVCEFRLLARLHAAGLPVPRPVAGGWRRHGLNYTADLMTAFLKGTASLADTLVGGRRDVDLARAVAACIARFHAFGAWHADLNAHNVLIDGEGTVSLIDFDRGRLRQPDPRWQQANLQRLRRSLVKVMGDNGREPGWLPAWWSALTAAHRDALERA